MAKKKAKLEEAIRLWNSLLTGAGGQAIAVLNKNLGSAHRLLADLSVSSEHGNSFVVARSLRVYHYEQGLERCSIRRVGRRRRERRRAG